MRTIVHVATDKRQPASGGLSASLSEADFTTILMALGTITARYLQAGQDSEAERVLRTTAKVRALLRATGR